MKLQRIIPLLLLVGCCVVNAQTTNAVSNPNKSPLLTAEQATLLALRLAKGKVDQLFKHAQPVYWPPPDIRAHFVAGGWVWTNNAYDDYCEFHAKVKLAPDGSTNSVVVKVTTHIDP